MWPKPTNNITTLFQSIFSTTAIIVLLYTSNHLLRPEPNTFLGFETFFKRTHASICLPPLLRAHAAHSRHLSLRLIQILSAFTRPPHVVFVVVFVNIWLYDCIIVGSARHSFAGNLRSQTPTRHALASAERPCDILGHTCDVFPSVFSRPACQAFRLRRAHCAD